MTAQTSAHPARPVARRRLVFIEWQDAAGPADGAWEHVRDMVAHHGYLCWSVGWVMDDGKTHVTIAPHCGNIDTADDEQVNGVMHIPKAMIRRMRTLRLP